MTASAARVSVARPSDVSRTNSPARSARAACRTTRSGVVGVASAGRSIAAILVRARPLVMCPVLRGRPWQNSPAATPHVALAMGLCQYRRFDRAIDGRLAHTNHTAAPRSLDLGCDRKSGGRMARQGTADQDFDVPVEAGPVLARRRLLFATAAVLTFALVLVAMARLLGANGLGPADLVLLACLAAMLPWNVIGFWNAGVGLAFLAFARIRRPACFRPRAASTMRRSVRGSRCSCRSTRRIRRG